MINSSKNKQISEAQDKNQLEEFHFPGGGEYEPLTVRAISRGEAEEIWMRERKKVE